MCNCKNILPSTYSISGPHIKETCSYCGKYIRFCHKLAIPLASESRANIWEVTNDTELIKQYKDKENLNSIKNTTEEKIAWNNILINIMKHFTT